MSESIVDPSYYIRLVARAVNRSERSAANPDFQRGGVVWFIKKHNTKQEQAQNLQWLTKHLPNRVALQKPRLGPLGFPTVTGAAIQSPLG